MELASEATYWQKDAKGRVLINGGGRLLAKARLSNEGRAPRGSYGLTMAHGAQFRVGYMQGGAFQAVTPSTTAAAKVGTICYLNVGIRFRADVPRLAVGRKQDRAMTALPDTDPKKGAKSHAGGVAWLRHISNIRPAVEVDGDIVVLCDELSTVPTKPGTLCQLKFWMRMDADILEPPEPEPNPDIEV